MAKQKKSVKGKSKSSKLAPKKTSLKRGTKKKSSAPPAAAPAFEDRSDNF